MKKLFFFLNVLLFAFISAQKDTAQIVVPNRVNAVADFQDKPYVIMISVDGFRYDYPTKYATPNINRLSKQGV